MGPSGDHPRRHVPRYFLEVGAQPSCAGAEGHPDQCHRGEMFFEVSISELSLNIMERSLTCWPSLTQVMASITTEVQVGRKLRKSDSQAPMACADHGGDLYLAQLSYLISLISYHLYLDVKSSLSPPLTHTQAATEDLQRDLEIQASQ